MNQPYTIHTRAHMGLFIHTLHLYKVELEHAVTRFQTPPDAMTARMLRGNDLGLPLERPKREMRAAT
jgi:hypothetical protein